MPPKAKFTRDEIIQMAFQIAKTEGLDKITARELGNRLGVGMVYITFSIREPKLFQLLFMSAGPEPTDVAHILPQIDASYEEILHSVQTPYGLDREAADRIYQHLWTYTHGIATMCATGLCKYTMEQISDRLTEIFKSLLMMEKGAYRNNDQN